DHAEGLNRAHRKSVVASESMRLFQEPVVTLVLGLGLMLLLTFTSTTFSAVVVLAFVFYRIMTHANNLQMRYQVMAVGESAFWSLRQQIEEARAAEEPNPGTRDATGLERAIELRDVRFSYGELKVLDGITIRVPAHQITALIGQSGSGKTTILDLVTGLQRPDSGEVLVDGVSLEELDLMSWRRLVGYVPQDVFLFHDTVRRNVTLGDDTISDDRVVQALKDAGAWDFIARDDAGIDAVVAPQGSNLSGGQRQRMAIARALVKAPALLILDEATTGLDTATEAAILETLSVLKQKVTILAVSHQPALRDTADLTLELSDGRLLTENAGMTR
ncbi:MAG TPA: ABC transporter ATP-binding protein, partial [Longimicrobiales bacterium]|nr:ABC transporter ATP-binding protein [Longimicrobiales bacterium]